MDPACNSTFGVVTIFHDDTEPFVASDSAFTIVWVGGAVRPGGGGGAVAWVSEAATAPYRWRGCWRGEKPGFWVGVSGMGLRQRNPVSGLTMGEIALEPVAAGLG